MKQTPVCMYVCVHTCACVCRASMHSYWGLTLPLPLCCVVDLEPCLLSCPGSSVGRALWLTGEQSVLGSSLTQGSSFFLEKKTGGSLLCTCIYSKIISIMLPGDMGTTTTHSMFPVAIRMRPIHRSGSGVLHTNAELLGGKDVYECIYEARRHRSWRKVHVLMFSCQETEEGR